MGITNTTLPRWAFPANSLDTFWNNGSAGGFIGAGATIAWGTANKIVYTPVVVRSRVVAVKLWFGSSTTGTDNCDVGIYDRAGTRIVNSGTIAKTASFDDNVSNIADTTIGPGLYYMAFQCTSATATFRACNPAASIPAAIGVRTESPGALGLPATATWVVDQGAVVIPICGMFLEPTPV